MRPLIPFSPRRPSWLLPLSVVLTLAAGEPLHAQAPVGRTLEAGMKTGIGYTPVVPDVMAGIGLWRLLEGRRFGAFADAKITFPAIEGDSEYCPALLGRCTVPEVESDRNDLKMRDFDEFLIVNLGGMAVLSPEFAVLVGGGMVRRSKYREYFHDEEDPEQRITESGGYYVPFDPVSSWAPQVVVGLLLRVSQNLVLRVGWEREPGGMSLGGYWVFPW